MPDMHDAFTLARALDARLPRAPAAGTVVDAFRDALYDYRADGDLDAFLERCTALLATLPAPEPAAPAVDGPCFRALDSLFSSG